MGADTSRLNCVFDMDETLAHFGKLFALTAFISTDVLTKEQYDNVISDIANAVKEGFDIGIFRPGLYKYFSFLHELQEKKILHSTTIYSNNGSQYTVSFMVDIINAWFPGLMCEGLSRQAVHSMGKNPEFRDADIIHGKGLNDSDVTAYKKQWATVQKIFENKSCGPVNITPEKTFFYDDKLHNDEYFGSDMKKTLGMNYIQTSEYFNGLNPDFWGLLYDIFKTHGILTENDQFEDRIIDLFEGTDEIPFHEEEVSAFRNGGYNYNGFLNMFKWDKLESYTPFGTHGSLQHAMDEYNYRWIPPIRFHLSDEQKAMLTTVMAGGRRHRKTRKRRQHKKRTIKKYSRK